MRKRGALAADSARGAMAPPSVAVTSRAEASADAPELKERRALWRGVFLVVIAALAAIAVAEAARVVWAVGRRLTNEDSGLLWYAAREWLHGRVHQPNFFGQGYGSTLEALPVTVLHGLAGVPYATAMSIGFEAFALGGWLLLALAAWRRRRRVLVVAALAFPLVLSGYHTVFLAVGPPSTAGRFLTIAGVAVLIGGWRNLAVGALAWSLVGVGLQLDPSSALLALPVAAWWALSEGLSRRHVTAIVCGAVVPLAYLVWRVHFYGRHPDYRFYDTLYGGASLRPRVSQLRDSLTGLGRLLGLYVPELVRWWPVPLVVLLTLVATLLATRRRVYAAPAGLVIVLFLYAISTSKAGSDEGPLLPSGRVLLLLPATLWFLLFLLAESGFLAGRRWWPAWSSQAAVALVVVVAVASSAVRTFDFGSRVGSWRTRATALLLSGHVGYLPTEWIAARCREDMAIARSASVGLVVYPENYRLGYACAAVAPDGITTLIPRYERRTWRMYEELRTRRTRMAVANVSAAFCDLARQRAECAWHPSHAPLSPGTAILRFPAQPALPLLDALGFIARPFGPHCHTLGNACRPRGARVDLRRSHIGPPPADARLARTEIERAYTRMFRTTGASSLPGVELGDRAAPRTIADLRSRPDLQDLVPRVLNVDFLDEHEATVDFEIGVRIVTGEAVVDRAVWRVALPTFCRILNSSGVACAVPG